MFLVITGAEIDPAVGFMGFWFFGMVFVGVLMLRRRRGKRERGMV